MQHKVQNAKREIEVHGKMSALEKCSKLGPSMRNWFVLERLEPTIDPKSKLGYCMGLNVFLVLLQSFLSLIEQIFQKVS